MLYVWGSTARNRARILVIRDEAPTAVEAFARMFTDASLADDGTVRGRLHTLLAATEHRFVPGLHTGLTLGMTGFRAEFEDPWPTSTDQVGHFLTAVRLTVDPQFLSNPVFPLLLGGLGQPDLPLRLMIGHEKMADPEDVSRANLKSLLVALRCFHAQYQSVTAQDVASFKTGHLELIQVGNGLGNSRADLRLSYTGWLFGHSLVDGVFHNREAVAHWIRTELGNGESP